MTHTATTDKTTASTADPMREHPLAAVGVAVAAGWMVAKIVRWIVKRR